MLQFTTEELVKEVENSIAEFKRHNQDYDEDRVKEQVRTLFNNIFPMRFSTTYHAPRVIYLGFNEEVLGNWMGDMTLNTYGILLPNLPVKEKVWPILLKSMLVLNVSV